MYVLHLKTYFFDKNSFKSFADSKICYTFAEDLELSLIKKNKIITYMKTITRILASAALLTGVFTACSDLSDLKDRVDSLESRVTALEKVIPNLNGNIEALQTLMTAGTINSAVQANGEWTICHRTSGSCTVGSSKA